MAPRVLISDALSPAAIAIFKARGVEVDFQPNVGKDEDKLAEIIGNFDGLAIRSATKITAKFSKRRRSSKSSVAPALASTMSISLRRPQRASS